MKLISIICCLCTLGLPLTSFAELDQYTRLSTISVPERPLLIMWGTYKTQEYTGAFVYNYDIPVPVGINGLEPNVSLTYNSQLVSTKPNNVASGWTLNSHSYIQRDIEYTRADTSDDTFDLILNGSRYDLIEEFRSSQVIRYSVINEPSMRVVFSNDSNKWSLYTKDGTEYNFGGSGSESILPISSTDETIQYDWQWSLREIKNVHGSRIQYNYYTDDDFPESKGVIYLKQIVYDQFITGNKKIIFDWEDKSVGTHIFINQGSEEKITKRLESITVLHEEVGLVQDRMSRHILTYEVNEATTQSLLVSITPYGKANILNNILPPTTFSYSALESSFRYPGTWTTPFDSQIRVIDGNDTQLDLVDMTGDGLPDFVHQDGSESATWDVYENLYDENTASFADSRSETRWRKVNRRLRYITDSGDTKGQLTDMNRDGFIDYVEATSNGFEITLNDNGENWGATESWKKPDNVTSRVRNFRGSTDKKAYQDLVDINGDGYKDIIKSDDDDLYIWFGKKDGGFEQTPTKWEMPDTVQHLAEYDDEDLMKGMLDINGDGLPDLIDATSNTWLVYINTGSEFLSAYDFEAPDNKIANLDNDYDTLRDVVDINGDGLPDYLVEHNRSGFRAYLNNGRAFSERDILWNFLSENIDGPELRKNNSTEVYRDIIDMNGDSLPDFVTSDDNDKWDIRYNNAKETDLLTNIQTTYGGTVAIEYKNSRRSRNKRLTVSQNLVEEVIENNGMSSADFNVTTKRSYLYDGGLFDYTDREFRGFDTVQIREGNADTVLRRKSISFNQGREDKGTIEREKIYSEPDDKLFLEKSFSYKITRNISTGYYQALLEKERITWEPDNASSKTILSEYNYDKFGSVTLESLFGDEDVEGDERFTLTAYLNDTSNDWHVGLPQKRVFYTDTPTNPIKTSEYFYDNKDNGFDKGLLTKRVDSLTTDSSIEYGFEYDGLGRLIKTIDPNGHSTAYSYRSSDTSLPSKIVNALGQETLYEYDSMGNITKETDPNGYITSFSFDHFFRPYEIYRPSDEDSPEVFQYSITNNPPHRITNTKASGNSVSPETISFIDGFGRLIQTNTKLDANRYIRKNTYYDALERVKSQSVPDGFFAKPSSIIGLSPSSYMQYTYDPLNRVTRITNPDFSIKAKNYASWSISEIDENNNQKQYEFDAYNQLVRIIEVGDSENRVVSYTYSPLGNLTKINNESTGDEWHMEYNHQNQLTKLNDPDRGIQISTYDGVGNLISFEKPGGTENSRHKTLYEYDPLNRLSKVTFPNDQVFNYAYDQTTIGTLSSVETPEVTNTYKYDARLRPTEKTVQIDNLLFTTQWEYNHADLIINRITPDGASTQFNYLEGGNLLSIDTIIDEIEYHSTGNIQSMQFNNDTSTVFDYDSVTTRLSNIQADDTNLSYRYDPKGNITSIINSVNGIKSYSYDAFNQIIQENVNNIETRFTYDITGNLIELDKDGNKTLVTINPSKPHQIKKVETQD